MAAPMSKLSSFICRTKVNGFRQFTPINLNTYTTALSTSNTTSSKGFPEKGPRGPFVRRPKREAGQPRTNKMDIDQDWTAVYPAATPFRQGSVPLPIRMGYPMKSGVPPEKKGNLELIKIPNFLHLTPEAVKKHCDALKPFCTEWPADLDSDDSCDELFPIKVESKNYVSAGTSIRNQSARTVELKVKLSSLNLDEHARKKMVKLVGERYCKETDILTISTNNCPLRQQNYDYSMYLLTALYHESWKTEAWEADKTVEDMEEYSWEDSPSQKNVLDMLVRTQEAGQVAGKEQLERPEVQEYRGSVIKLKNEGENEETMMQYKEAVKKLLKV